MSARVSGHNSSFRDPAGFIFEHSGSLYRQVNFAGKQDYDYLIESGLYKKLTDEKLLISHKEASKPDNFPASPERYKVIIPTVVPFISYPYEWTFSQLKTAALLTLKIQKIALNHGMILKDASAYNVQFVGAQAIFIDTLSFRIYKTGAPWDGYKQFCQHFVAPLAVAAHSQAEAIRWLQISLDGIPLNLATSLLPSRSKRRWGLLTHLHMHAASQKRYDNSEEKTEVKVRKVSQNSLNAVTSSLQRAVTKLKPPKDSTQWGDYYDKTNYSTKAFSAKQKIVKEMLARISPSPQLAWDLGANDGTFSKLAAELGAYTVAFDIDYKAVERNFSISRSGNLLPIVQDLTNPSPALGWAHQERLSLEQRGPADVVLALALVHHLAITNTLPLSNIAGYFRKISKHLIIEFVPKEDSKTKLLLLGRNNIFHDYDQKHFEAAFSTYFKLIEKKEVPESHRVIYLYKAKAS